MEKHVFKDNNNNNCILFEGENLDILNQLLPQYKERIKLIYIDPLYNAANKNFKNYKDNVKNWSLFMTERLLLAKEFLTTDGLIYISIGEEVCNLKLICDEIFGVENQLAMFSVKTPNRTEGLNIIKNTDYLLVYRKTANGQFNLPNVKQEARCTTSKPTQTIHTVTIPAGVRAVKIPDGIYSQPKHIGGYEDLERLSKEPIVVKNGVLANKVRLRGRWSCPNDVKAYFDMLDSEEKYPVYNKYGKELVDFYLYGPRFIPYLVKIGNKKPCTFLESFISRGKDELKTIIGDNNFAYPKHSSLIKFVLETGISSNEDIVLDFFAGSGTTGQAVFEYNEEYDANIDCILITNNENNIINNITIPRLENVGLKKAG